MLSAHLSFIFISINLFMVFFLCFILLCLPFCAVSDLEYVFNFFKTSPLTKSHPLFKFFQYMTHSIPSNPLWNMTFLSVVVLRFKNKTHTGWFLFPSHFVFLLLLTFSPSPTFIKLTTPFPLRDPSFQVLNFLFYSRRENGLRSPRLTSGRTARHSMFWYG